MTESYRDDFEPGTSGPAGHVLQHLKMTQRLRTDTMNTITIGKTRYTTNRPDILALHAKCTGKHKAVKSKGAERRLYPKFWDGQSTAQYIVEYFRVNTMRVNRGGPSIHAYADSGNQYTEHHPLALYEPLPDTPCAVYTDTDTMEICE